MALCFQHSLCFSTVHVSNTVVKFRFFLLPLILNCLIKQSAYHSDIFPPTAATVSQWINSSQLPKWWIHSGSRLITSEWWIDDHYRKCLVETRADSARAVGPKDLPFLPSPLADVPVCSQTDREGSAYEGFPSPTTHPTSHIDDSSSSPQLCIHFVILKH